MYTNILLAHTPYMSRDGKSNYMEGLMLITLYFVVTLASKVANIHTTDVY